MNHHGTDLSMPGGAGKSGMRTASVRSSAKDPRPDPSTSPICGRSEVRERTKAAADSARVNRSDVINGYVGTAAPGCPAEPSSARKNPSYRPSHSSCDCRPCLAEDVSTRKRSANKLRKYRIHADEPPICTADGERKNRRLPATSRETPHEYRRFRNAIAPGAQFPCHPAVHGLHSIEE